MIVLNESGVEEIAEKSTLWNVSHGVDDTYKLMDYYILTNGHYLALEYDKDEWIMHYKCLLCEYYANGDYVTCANIAVGASIPYTIKHYFQSPSTCTYVEGNRDISDLNAFDKFLSDEAAMEKFKKHIFVAQLK